MDRRTFLAGTAASTLVTPSFAQDYPARPVTFVNPFPPGGAADVVARPLAAVLEPLVKQAVVIETKAGAAGQVGAQFAASAKPDGYTLLVHIVSISGFAEADRINGRQPKFTLADFIPIARFTSGPMALYVNDQQPYKTVKELVDDAKKNPELQWNPLAKEWGINGIPKMFLIDKKGVLRSVEARKDFEEEIPKLLAEKAE